MKNVICSDRGMMNMFLNTLDQRFRFVYQTKAIIGVADQIGNLNCVYFLNSTEKVIQTIPYSNQPRFKVYKIIDITEIEQEDG